MKKYLKKSFIDLDNEWIDQVRVNLSAVERRTASLTKRRTVKKEYQVAWLLKAITLLDLTTLSGDDTLGKVEKLCIKGLNPISIAFAVDSPGDHFGSLGQPPPARSAPLQNPLPSPVRTTVLID